MKKITFFILFLFYFTFSFSQDISYARKIIDSLCSPYMYGRGYANNGDKKAADFIQQELINDNIKPFGKSYLQPFDISVNTLPGKVSIKIDNNMLKPGADFLVSSNSKNTEGTFKIVWLTKDIIKNDSIFSIFRNQDYHDKVIIIDKTGITDGETLQFTEFLRTINLFRAKAVIFPDDKLVWGISNGGKETDFIVIDILKNKIPADAKQISIEIQNKYFEKYTTNNVTGYIEGKTYPDSFVVFTAHYDHLGIMGAGTYFPGANDNASGTAMVLNLAKYYSENRPDYSVAFMLFSAEDAGLLGSEYYTGNPLFPLEKIKFLINLDLVGTGDDGITIVNGSVFEKEFNTFVKINEEKKYLKAINKRGEAANSDHYPFYEKGVKSIFIYTLGGIAEYHNIYDKAETLPLTEYNDLFKLLIDFVKKLNN